MTYPVISPARRLEMLEWPVKPVRMVLDTDTFNEVDDQFALAYTLLSPDRLHCEAIYAAPFFNDRSTGPEDGMLKSYDEILRILARMDRPAEGFVHLGSRRWLTGADGPVPSPAADDLVRRALARCGRPALRGRHRRDHQRGLGHPRCARDHRAHRRGVAGRQPLLLVSRHRIQHGSGHGRVAADPRLRRARSCRSRAST